MRAVPSSLKPQDILVLLGLLLWKEDRKWKFQDLATNLSLSLSEVHQSIKRTQMSGLYDPLTRRPIRAALQEFICHGLRYVFPAMAGKTSQGIPTAWSAPPLSEKIISSKDNQVVWPSNLGEQKGAAVKPLYPTVPEAVKRIPELYPFFALIDGLRIGKAREREIAKEELQRRIFEA